MTYVLPAMRAAFLAMLLIGVVAWDAGPLQSGGVWVDRSAIVHVDPSGGAAVSAWNRLHPKSHSSGVLRGPPHRARHVHAGRDHPSGSLHEPPLT